MNYSDHAHMCRVDFFKETGKWYCTEAVSWEGLYDAPMLIHDAFKQALRRHWPDGKPRHSGMTAVCLEPYHEHGHPITLVIPDAW